MTTLVRLGRAALIIALMFGIGWSIRCVAAHTQPDGNPWELNAGDLQAAGLHLASYMSTVGDMEDYQKNLPSHQEILIEWDPHTGFDHPAYREQVAERSLKHDFALQQRKQKVKGDARTGPTTLLDLGLVVVAATSTGEVRGFAIGPSLLIRGEATHVPGERPPERHDYIQSKTAFWVGLPDDPKIEKLVLLVAYPSEKPRLEQVATIDLTTKVTPK
jgi:hypothetical protein